MSATTESFLLFSDVHLGSDLNDAGPADRRSAAIDRDLAALLAHYRASPPPCGRWTVIVAGDFIDLVGIAVDPDADEACSLATPLSAEERRNGVGSAEDRARLKLRRVARRHAEIFAGLAAMVAEGHSLTFVIGNHDLELHWEGAQEELRALLFEAREPARGGPGEGRSADDRVAFFRRIAFSPLFFHREGVVYVEHGHQYDAFCSTALPMVPVCPRDPSRISRAFSDVLLRNVVRRTEGMKEHGHEHIGIPDYLRFGLRLGLRGSAALFGRFVRSIAELFRIRSGYRSEAARGLRREHEQRAFRLAEETRLGRDRIATLLSLHARPIALSIRGILASVLLDRVALGALAVAGVAAFALSGHGLRGMPFVLGGWVVSHGLLSRARVVDPAAKLVERAGRLAALFSAPFVVMGHTHVPLAVRSGDAMYLNLGAWAEGEDDGFRASRTHLVIHQREVEVEACLSEWSPGEGPRASASHVARLARLTPTGTVAVEDARPGRARGNGDDRLM